MEGTVTISPTCLNCGKPLKGRIDKKFCDAGCKNEHNNGIQRQERDAIKSIDRILKHNRRTLKKCLGDHCTRLIQTKTLLQVGFRFDYYTHHFTNHQAHQYIFCYEYGYLPLPDGRCLVIKERISQRDQQ